MTMFQIVADLEHYQCFFPVEDDDNFLLGVGGYMDFRGVPRPNWKGARVFMTESFKNKGKLPVPDIARFSANALAYSQKAVALLKGVLEDSGELLPLDYNGETWFIHNILNAPKAIDYEKSEYDLLDSGEYVFSKKAIDQSKLNNISLFKIEQENYSVIYCHEIEDRTLDFKHQVEKSGLTGVQFLFPDDKENY